MTDPPDRWLQGRAYIRELEGLNHKDALHQAILDWQEQEGLAGELDNTMPPAYIYRGKL